MIDRLCACIITCGLLPICAAQEEKTVSIHVYSSTTSKMVANAEVTLTFAGVTPLQGVTNADGIARIAGVPVVTNQPGPIPAVGEITILHSGHVPYRAHVTFSQLHLNRQCELVARDTGYTTPILSAADGATVNLPGLGSLTVDPGALNADASLRIIPMPMASWPFALVTGDIQHCVWVSAHDALGQPLQGALSLLGGVRLTTALPYPSTPVETILSESWSVSAFDPFLASRGTATLSTPSDDGSITFAVAEGHCLVCRHYTAQSSQTCVWGPWVQSKYHVGSRAESQANHSFNCGLLGTGGSVTTGSSSTHTTGSGLNQQVSAKTGIEMRAIVARVAAEAGVSMSYDSETGIATQASASSTINTPPAGQSALPGVANSQCLNGTMHVGWHVDTYKISFTRLCMSGGQVVDSQTEDGGTIDVQGPLETWFSNMAWNPACPGCPALGVVPPGIPGPRSF
jgi:hypothetical protein